MFFDEPFTSLTYPNTMQDRINAPSRHAERKNNQNEDNNAGGDLEAFGTGDKQPGDQDQVQDEVLQRHLPVPKPKPQSLSERDETLLHHLVCFRLLTYAQIHRLLFSSVDPSFSRRRIRVLARNGWLTIWEPPSLAGGHVRYAHPTQRALRHVLPSLENSERWGSVVRLMLPRTKRRPMQLAEAAVPKWLPHQREVNHLVVSITKAPQRKILWASSWDSPFPPRLGIFRTPQPDYVLIEEIDGQAELIFGEHDRASEPIDRFIARKITLYAALARFPEACEKHFGLRAFRVEVTVTDPHRRAPIRRLRDLVDATRRHGGPDIFQFTLAGWLHAYPNDPIWFDIANPPTSDSVSPGEHPQTRALRVGVLPAST